MNKKKSEKVKQVKSTNLSHCRSKVPWNINNLNSKCENKDIRHSSRDTNKVGHRKRQKGKSKSKDRNNMHNSLKNIVGEGRYLELRKNNISKM
jgi:hypothetical protein